MKTYGCVQKWAITFHFCNASAHTSLRPICGVNLLHLSFLMEENKNLRLNWTIKRAYNSFIEAQMQIGPIYFSWFSQTGAVRVGCTLWCGVYNLSRNLKLCEIYKPTEPWTPHLEPYASYWVFRTYSTHFWTYWRNLLVLCALGWMWEVLRTLATCSNQLSSGWKT